MFRTLPSLSIIFAAALVVSCGGGGGGGGGNTGPDPALPIPDPAPDNRPSVSAMATDYYTGSPVSDAVVSVRWGGSSDEFFSAETNSTGKATLRYPEGTNALTIYSDAEGYAEFGRTFNFDTETIAVSLIPVHTNVTIDSGSENEILVDGESIISLPANAFVDADGNAFSGNIDAELTVIDPREDPELMPGQYEALDGTTGEISNIESFGAINATFEDADGNPLQLASGQTATVRIPLSGDSSDAPESIPLFYYDDESGYWVEEGSATLTEISGEFFYVGTVSHFTTWNADRVYETIFLTGCAVNEDSSVAAGVRITATGIDYTGTSSVYTDAFGSFTIPVRMNSDLRIQASGNGLLSGSQEFYSSEEDETLSDCLTLSAVDISIELSWSEEPEDLDTHLEGPDDASDSGQFHLYFSDDDLIVGDESIFIDVDDTDGFGPEITYLSGFPYDGTYSYYVYLYSGEGSIQGSPARVELNIADNTSVFAPPSGEPSECWHVFDINVSGGEPALTTVGEWVTRDDCYGSAEEEEGDGDVAAASASSATVPAKYYAK
ncbi:MAG: hypothetical protein CMH97_07830 [Oceanospirillaceae bacterium]|nr:hypothetical protein [Oceanospirillaceae bacterium]